MAEPQGPVLSETEGIGTCPVEVLPEMGNETDLTGLASDGLGLGTITDPKLPAIGRRQSRAGGKPPHLE